MTTDWVTFTRRTDDLKLLWLERRLDDRSIPHRRNGESAHAPILEVPGGRLDEAWTILTPVDDWDDDDPRFDPDESNEVIAWDLPREGEELDETP